MKNLLRIEIEVDTNIIVKAYTFLNKSGRNAEFMPEFGNVCSVASEIRLFRYAVNEKYKFR